MGNRRLSASAEISRRTFKSSRSVVHAWMPVFVVAVLVIGIAIAVSFWAG
jgi:hypothetical protein